jgi:hypothetical protein
MTILGDEFTVKLFGAASDRVEYTLIDIDFRSGLFLLVCEQQLEQHVKKLGRATDASHFHAISVPRP